VLGDQVAHPSPELAMLPVCPVVSSAHRRREVEAPGMAATQYSVPPTRVMPVIPEMVCEG
jgi:hypothetical protein